MRRKGTITVMLVDDEPLALEGLRDILSDAADLSIVAEAHDGEEALRLFALHRPDVVFLDIQMPGLDGFDVLKRLGKEAMPIVVFVTAYDEFAVKAFSAHALDYILKPFDAERLQSALQRIRELMSLRDRASYADRLAGMLRELPGTPTFLQRIPIRETGRIRLIDVKDAAWIEAAADYIIVHTADGKHTTRELLGSIETQLDPSLFLRIHRSVIVNVRWIREVRPDQNGDLTVTLTDGTLLNVGRTYRERLTSLYG